MNLRRNISRLATTTALVALPLVSSPAYTDYKTNPLSSQDIFYGSNSQVKELRVIDYEFLTKSTPEYQEILKKKIEPGTGKYWILMSQASDRVIKSINNYAQKNNIDTIAKKSAITSFEILPTDYQDKSNDYIFNKIDITKKIINSDKDLELPKLSSEELEKNPHYKDYL